MELRHLRYFVAVAEEMNIHRAAERLNISQPPLSVTIKQLEEELGVSLFEREGRGIKITRAGESFLDQAKKILKDTNKAVMDAQNIGQGKAGTIRVGFISSAITGVLQNLVAQHRKLYPNINIEMEQSVADWIADKVLNNEFDIGIVRSPIYLNPELNIKEITHESWSAAINAKHHFAKKKSLHVKDLEGEPLIFYPRWNGPAGYDDLMQMFQEHDVTPYIHQEAPEQMTIAGLVASGMGIGIMPECMAKIKVPNVVHRPILNTENRTGFSIICRKDNDILVNQFLGLAVLMA